MYTVSPRFVIDPLRAYVIALRKAAGLSQEAVAKDLGLTRGAYIKWETGETQDIKLSSARRLLRLLGGALEHLDDLEFMNVEQARELAERWRSTPEDEKPAALRAQAKLRRVIELSDDDPISFERLIEQLRDDSRADPALLDAISGYLDGRRAGRRR